MTRFCQLGLATLSASTFSAFSAVGLVLQLAGYSVLWSLSEAMTPLTSMLALTLWTGVQ